MKDVTVVGMGYVGLANATLLSQHNNVIALEVIDYFALPSPPISNSSPPIRQSSPPLFLNQIRPLRQPIRTSSPLDSLFCV